MKEYRHRRVSADWVPQRPLPDTRGERLAQLIVQGQNQDGSPMTLGHAYAAAGYHCKTPFSACSGKLKIRANGLQARVDFLRDQVAKGMVEERTKLEKRRLHKLEARQDEVGEKLDHLWKLATQMRPKLTPHGQPVMNPLSGEVLMEPASFPCAQKLVELLGVDAGMFIRQSRSGKIGDDFANLTDQNLRAQLTAELEKVGLTIVPIPSGNTPVADPDKQDDPNPTLN